jgi:hypothetical protein
MLLTTEDGEPFATGMALYSYRPAINDISNRIILQVEIGGAYIEAIVDTGSPYVVCPPYLSDVIGFDPADAIESVPFLIRGIRMRGNLYRVNILLPADEGEDIMVDGTVFVPDEEWQESWGEHPAFIGLTGCLERMRFAVDPENDRFYFGPL